MLLTGIVGIQHAVAEWAKFEITCEIVQRLIADFMALCVIPRFAIFIVKFLYFQVFHNFHIFTLNWCSKLFQISVFSATLKVFTTPQVG